MVSPIEAHRAGPDYLELVTRLLDRIRTTDPRSGLYEAAELHWWWAQMSRVTDDVDQLFWLDEDGRPLAAAIVTDWRGSTQLDPIVMPDAEPSWVATVIHRGLDHARSVGIETVSLEVDRDDQHLRAVLSERGFSISEAGMIESWMEPSARPAVSELHDGYRLLDRVDAGDRPHHMINSRRDHEDPVPRLAQSSLYRPELDLALYTDDGAVAAYGLFWVNPTTGVGVLEPMRTEDDHQQRGLARHLLTVGIDRMAHAGATRLKVCFDPGNGPARHLYLSSGFEPDRENDVFNGPTGS